ncbi:hypothetical protein MDA_GLEAN10002027 [Myotis davidii]|uniref:Uncharacterized protein n=1 Tax=Myotis davidii TaxID=225400 RepID=L5M8Q5_MYODS|nr:hypothetical protein MDA_GLEAN10002027 [Myotis davidii]
MEEALPWDYCDLGLWTLCETYPDSVQVVEPAAEEAHTEEGELCLLNNVHLEGDINYQADQEGDNGQEGNIGQDGDIRHEAHSNHEGGGGDQEPRPQLAAMADLLPAAGPQHENPKPRMPPHIPHWGDRNGDQPDCGPGEGQATSPVFLGTSGCTCAYSLVQERDKPPTLWSWAPVPAALTRERDKPPILRSWVPVAAAQAKPHAHGLLWLQQARVKLAWVQGACGRPEGGKPGSQVPATSQRRESWVLGVGRGRGS